MNKKNIKEKQEKRSRLASKHRILLISVIVTALIATTSVVIILTRPTPQERAFDLYFVDLKNKGFPASSCTILEMRKMKTEEDVQPALEEFLASYGSYARIDNASLLMSEETAEKLPLGSYFARVQYNLTPGSWSMNGPDGSNAEIIVPESAQTMEVAALIEKTDSGFDVINESYQMSTPTELITSKQSGSIEYTLDVYYDLGIFGGRQHGNTYKFKSDLSVTGSPDVIYPGGSPQSFIFEMEFYSWEEKKEWWADTWDPYHIIGSGGGWPNGWGNPSTPWESKVRISVPGATTDNGDYFSTGSKLQGNKGRGSTPWSISFGLSYGGDLGVSPPTHQGGVTFSGSRSEISIKHSVGFGGLGTINDWGGIYTDGGTFRFEANIAEDVYPGSETGRLSASVPVNVVIYRWNVIATTCWCQAGTFSPQVKEYIRGNSLIQPTVSTTVTPETGVIHQGETCTLTVKITNNSKVAKMEGVTVKIDTKDLQNVLFVKDALEKISEIGPGLPEEVTFTLEGRSEDEIVPTLEIEWDWDRSIFTLLDHKSFLFEGSEIKVLKKPDFSITAEPPKIAVLPGEEGTSKITLTSLGGFSDTISLEYTTRKSNIKIREISLTPASLTLPENGTAIAVLNVSIDSRSAPRTAIITITASDGSIIHTIDVEVEVLTPPKPDLRWTSFDGNLPQVGESLLIKATLTNVGTRPAPGGYTVLLEIFDCAQQCVVYSWGFKGMALDPGEAMYFWHETKFTFSTEGAYYLTLTADSTDDIDEIYEDNNTEFVEFCVWSPSLWLRNTGTEQLRGVLPVLSWNATKAEIREKIRPFPLCYYEFH
ncbi:MAG: hypothetical protein AYK18_00750 [Theionarchaea archaeon DG-70]|nr:MAG: hypothetical protein AYK18_00750 [Theionarchaea archaeon DG-70]